MTHPPQGNPQEGNAGHGYPGYPESGYGDDRTRQFPPQPDSGGGQAYSAYGPQGPWQGQQNPQPQPQPGPSPFAGGQGWDSTWQGAPQYPAGTGVQWQQQPAFDPASVVTQDAPRSRKGLLLGLAAGLVVVIAAVVVVLGFAIGPKFFVTTVLDTADAEASITNVLTNDYGISGVTDVSCPSDITVKSGHQFECTAVISGSATTITSTFTGDKGDYVVSSPSGT